MQQIEKQKISTIIFDLGGVVIDLHPMKTVEAFGRLLRQPANHVVEWQEREPFFKAYEKGLISDADFRNHIRELADVNLIDENIDSAWNAMLGNIPKKRVERIKQLGNQIRLLVLSNTNAIHIRAFNQILERSIGHQQLHEIFDRVYFSHELHERKPDAAIFETILNKEGLSASECLFLEDTKANIIGAEAVGINGMHITDADQQIDELVNYFHGR